MHRLLFFALLTATAVPAASAFADKSAEQQMANRIGTQLKQSGQLHHYRINVRYHNGVAYLEGTVTSVQQRTIAVRLVQHVRGVSKVQYKLEIPTQTASETESKSAEDHDHCELAEALDRAAQDGTDGATSNVVHAYQEASEPPFVPNQSMQMVPENAPQLSNMAMRRNNMPLPSRRMPSMMPVRQASSACASCNGGAGMGPGMAEMGGAGMAPAPMGFVPQGSARGPSYDNASMPAYAWPSYASYPNYAALTYPQQYSPTAWPYIGPFYPYPQVPLAWRKVSLEWDDGWWFLDFSSHNSNH
ncbi:MAG TPA: BON domain-containing protein [Lacipirellulaceae bacterium]|nr:BON domain-containing protein [Lacipirellulaceae bacterium]